MFEARHIKVFVDQYITEILESNDFSSIKQHGNLIIETFNGHGVPIKNTQDFVDLILKNSPDSVMEQVKEKLYAIFSEELNANPIGMDQDSDRTLDMQ